MDSLDRLDGKGCVPPSAFWHAGGDQSHQVRPRHNALHLAQKLALVRAFARRTQLQALLLHARIVSVECAGDMRSLGICADPPSLEFEINAIFCKLLRI